ncbi:MAG: peptidoglycan DD-metalloendopeptidase family protein [Anaerolineae bacterium]|nr:peptidoglycan DD-metalloendopeptidase family protein [Anaerolineae bacterium]
MPDPVIPPTPTRTPLPDLPVTDTPTATAIIADLPPATPQPPPTTAPTGAEPMAEVTSGAPGTPTITGTPGTATSTPPPPTPDDGLPADHYWFSRPIPTGWTDYLDRTYAYGSTAGGKYRAHTGGDFYNPSSTPVVAVANATVMHAGTDWETQFGPALQFYGNLVVLQVTDNTLNGQLVYVLYGHLSEVYAQAGQIVKPGDIIGAVGATGVAIGPHLHFEVRIGDPYSYTASTRNPDLWIKPYYGFGTLAGRVVDKSGTALPQVAVTLRGAGQPRYAWTYAGAENRPDDAWGETFTYGDLPEGWYSVTTSSGSRAYTQDVYIRPGRTSWVEFVFQ